MSKRIKLITAMARKGMLQTDLATKTGISRVTISQIVNGKKPGKLETWKKIAAVLGVELGEIIE